MDWPPINPKDPNKSSPGIAQAFPGGVLPSAESIHRRPRGEDQGVYQARRGPQEPFGNRDGNDPVQRLREEVESESRTSDPVTEMISERGEEPLSDAYRYMLGEVQDLAEDLWFRSHDRYPARGDQLVGLEQAPPSNGHRVHMAALHGLHGQVFVSRLDTEPPIEEDQYSDTFSNPGEAIQRLLGPEAEAGGRGRRGGQRRVPCGHPEWVPPPGGGAEIEIREDASLTESDGGFELLEPWRALQSTWILELRAQNFEIEVFGLASVPNGNRGSVMTPVLVQSFWED